MSYFNRISTFLGTALFAVCTAQAAPVEVDVWLTLSPYNLNELEKLAKQFNNEQNETKVNVKGFPNRAALRAAGQKAIAENRKPNLVQIEDDRSPELTAMHKEILPLHELLKQYPISDLNWFLPQTTGFMRNSKQQLLAFPFMAEIPLMFYNIDGYKKSGLDANKPPATWIELQGNLIALRDKADYTCPYGTSQQVNIHLENLAPINDVLLVTPNNGLDTGKQQPELNFDSVFMRHLSIMVSWKRSDLFTQHTNGDEADEMFAKNKCAVVTTGSGVLGQFLDTRGLKFGVAPLPHYQQVSEKPGTPFVGGSALWATSGHSKEENKATMSFLAFLSKPVVASAWHQKTGFLPLTDAAYRTADVAFYDKVPGARNVIASMKNTNHKNSRGFRVKNYQRVESIMSREFDAALNGTTPPVQALNIAMSESKPLMQDPSVPSKAPATTKKK